MLKIVIIMLAGIGLGTVLRNKNLSYLPQVITTLIWLLLFLLGIEVGGNPQIIGGLQQLGWEALLLTLSGVAGSILTAWSLWRYIKKKECYEG